MSLTPYLSAMALPRRIRSRLSVKRRLLEMVQHLVHRPVLHLLAQVGRLAAADAVGHVRSNRQRIGVFGGVAEAEYAFRHRRVARLRRQHAHEPLVAAENVLPDLEDLQRPLSRKVPRGLAALVLGGQAQGDALLTGVVGLLKLPVPDFVGVLDVNHQLRAEPFLDQTREVADVIVVGQMRDAKPRGDHLLVAQLDHPLQRHSAFRERRVLQRRPLAPLADFRAVGVHPVHEPEAGEALPAFQKVRMERVFFPSLLEAGHDDANVADRPLGLVSWSCSEKPPLLASTSIRMRPAWPP